MLILENMHISLIYLKDAKWTAEEAKAYVQDLSIAVRTAKVGKKVKVTVNADVQTLSRQRLHSNLQVLQVN